MGHSKLSKGLVWECDFLKVCGIHGTSLKLNESPSNKYDVKIHLFRWIYESRNGSRYKTSDDQLYLSQDGMSVSVKQLLAFFLFLFLFSIVRRRKEQKKANPHGLPYPPGPKPLPVLGNLFDFIRENESQAYLRLAHKYATALPNHPCTPLKYLRVQGILCLVVGKSGSELRFEPEPLRTGPEVQFKVQKIC